MRFSFIIPHHSSGSTDRRAMMEELIASIPDRSDVEIIVVDDHSEMVWTPANVPTHARLILLDNLPDQRYAGTARNVALDKASGDVLFFADSDDRFDNQALLEVMDLAVSRLDVDVFAFRMGSFREDGSEGSRHAYVDAHFKSLIAGDAEALFFLISPCIKAVRRSFVERHGLRFGASKFANDHTFATRLALADPRVHVVDRVVYMARQGNEGLTSSPSTANIVCRIEVFAESAALVRKSGRNHILRPPLSLYWPHLLVAPGPVGLALLRAHKSGTPVLPSLSEIVSLVRRKMGAGKARSAGEDRA